MGNCRPNILVGYGMDGGNTLLGTEMDGAKILLRIGPNILLIAFGMQLNLGFVNCVGRKRFERGSPLTRRNCLRAHCIVFRAHSRWRFVHGSITHSCWLVFARMDDGDAANRMYAVSSRFMLLHCTTYSMLGTY
jgi:hypothetical protein